LELRNSVRRNNVDAQVAVYRFYLS